MAAATSAFTFQFPKLQKGCWACPTPQSLVTHKSPFGIHRQDLLTPWLSAGPHRLRGCHQQSRKSKAQPSIQENGEILPSIIPTRTNYSWRSERHCFGTILAQKGWITTSEKPVRNNSQFYSGELFNPCSRKQAFSAMAAPQFVSSASRDLKPFCPLFRAEGEISIASVLRTQLQGPGFQGPRKSKARYCPIPCVPCIQLLLPAAPLPRAASSHLPPRGLRVRSTWPRKPQPVLTRVQFDLHSPKWDSPGMEKTAPCRPCPLHFNQPVC